MDLTTTYMGLELKNPLVLGASPLSDYAALCRRCEDAGASAVVMHSLFMEQIAREYQDLDEHVDSWAFAHPEASGYLPDPVNFRLGPEEYLEQVARLKSALSIPVIGSLNGIHLGGWVHHARLIEEAGADGLELNVYYLPLRHDEAPELVEARYLDILQAVRAEVKIPVAMKLSYFFSSPIHLAQRLEAAGADALVLFNRLFHPDIDIERLEVRPTLNLSSPAMLHMRLMWLAALFGRVGCSLAATGGVHSAEDTIKAIMAGADVTQLTSALLRQGPSHISFVRDELSHWLEEHEYDSLRQMRGSMSLTRCPDPEAYERANYMRTLQSWKPTSAW